MNAPLGAHEQAQPVEGAGSLFPSNALVDDDGQSGNGCAAAAPEASKSTSGPCHPFGTAGVHPAAVITGPAGASLP
jgi:hypothetical protein